LTVAGNIAYGISHVAQPEQAERVADMLEFVGISHLAHAKPAIRLKLQMMIIPLMIFLKQLGRYHLKEAENYLMR
jgi:hypothetical protein